MTCASLIVSRFMLVLCLALCSPNLTLAQTGKAAITALMPQPRSINYGGGWLPVKGGFRVEWLGVGNSVLDRAVSRFQNDLAQRTGLDVGRAGSAQLRIEQFFYS